jgi:DNA-binding transcriptional LysR family regulator
MLWDDLRVFLAVVRRGSHKAAARQLGVDPTTVGRRLTALDAALGTKLFERTPERLVPTPAGLALSARAERIEAELLAAERDVQGVGARLGGRLRVTATDGLVHYLLLPALGELRLRQLLPWLARPTCELWGVYTAELRGDARVEAFLLWLRGVLDDSADRSKS